MIARMKRTIARAASMPHPAVAAIPLSLLLVAASAVAGAQSASPYQGVSHPPTDDEITTSTIPEAKPPAGRPLAAQPAAPAYQAPPASAYDGAQYQERSSVMSASPGYPQSRSAQSSDPAPPSSQSVQFSDGTDDGIVHVAASAPAYGAPASSPRANSMDPDNDIVHVRPLRPGELQEGTAIRVRLLDRLSTAMTESGQPFHTRVATDVMQGGQVVIPAGAEIDGRVVAVSSGHFAGHGTMRLAPETVILPDGTRFRLHAEVSSTPGSNTRVGGEGTIQPGSRLKRDTIEYAGGVGAGAATGAIVAGPVGALTGSLIGAGAITVHLLVDHPQATLESGTTLMFTLTDPLYLAPETMNGN